MSRTPRYRTCDDLIDNCEVINDCFIWPHSDHSQTSPVISPYSPIARMMFTNSVARILFTVIRHVPVTGRLVKWCNSPYCVNPYHYSEHRTILAKRIKAGKTSDMLPEQERARNLYPTDEDIRALKPRDPDIMDLLIRQASITPYDSKNLPSEKRIDKIVPDSTKRVERPFLVMKPRYEKPVYPVQTKEELDAEADAFFNRDIFKEIEERKKRMLQKAVQDWELPAK